MFDFGLSVEYNVNLQLFCKVKRVSTLLSFLRSLKLIDKAKLFIVETEGALRYQVTAP